MREEFEPVSAYHNNPALWAGPGSVLAKISHPDQKHYAPGRCPSAYMRLQPTQCAEEIHPTNAEELVKKGNLHPMRDSTTPSGFDVCRNEFGAAVFGAINDELRFFTQLHTSRELWGFDN